MIFAKPNRFRFLFWNCFGFFELSSIDKVMATGFRKCFVCGSMKNGVCFREGDDVFLCDWSFQSHKNAPRDAHSREKKMSQATALGARVPQAELFASECRGWEFFAGVKGRPLIGSRAEALPGELSLRQFVRGITCRKRKVMQLRCGCRRVQKRRKNE